MAKAKYEPVGSEVSFESSMCQAASALDVAAQLAVDKQDVDKIIEIGSAWVVLAQILRSHPEPETEDEPTMEKPFQVGFTTEIGEIDE